MILFVYQISDNELLYLLSSIIQGQVCVLPRFIISVIIHKRFFSLAEGFLSNSILCMNNDFAIIPNSILFSNEELVSLSEINKCNVTNFHSFFCFFYNVLAESLFQEQEFQIWSIGCAYKCLCILCISVLEKFAFYNILAY